MKKYVLILLLLTTGLAYEAKADFTGGLRIGFNASKYTGTLGSAYNFAPGVHIGPYFRVSIKEKYRIQAEVLFSTKGSTMPFFGETFYDLPFYLDVPVMFNYKPVAGLYIEAGVQPSFALTALQFSANTETIFDKTGLKTLDFAPVAGIGYDFGKVTIGLRGAFGVTNIDNSAWSTLMGTKTKNLNLMLGFGFKF